ncbi:putative WRKY transcription factor 2 [Iris pallida]|uniref:WRKY transcription factor 2 n=1 Tax=Iris pallida TaxID=29817 RepID=A0AAX6E8N9_IRIPA|nr:putative WRKY transcription factor 2 [Iris pallida]
MDMTGIDDKMTAIEDWLANPSPRTLLSNFSNQDFGSKSFSDLLSDGGNGSSMLQSEEQKMALNPKEEGAGYGFQFSSNFSLGPSLYDVQNPLSKGGLAQRIARAGFSAPTINTTRIRSANMAPTSSEVRSPYLTIPPGLSPTTLLDSPVFLSNSMAQLSPTTGKILFAQGNNSNSVSLSAVQDKSKDDLEDIIPGGFAFKPPMNNTSSSYLTSPENKGTPVVDQQQSLPSAEVSVQQDFNRPAGFSQSPDRKDDADDIIFCPRPSESIGNENSPPPDDHPDGEVDPKGEFSSICVAAPAEDGYNWRKYGQKQVKGSEYPRSYYKCTHQNCQVKKKVERSHEGHITEIIYKGAHNHPKPTPNRRSVLPSSHLFNDTQIDGLEHPGTQPNFDGKPLCASDGMEVTSSASVAIDGDPSASLQQDGSRYGSPEAIDVSSTLSNEEDDDQVTHGTVSVGGDVEGDETESKRRKLDTCNVEMSSASRAVREPRVVVQTTSEVDILDDGYRWRKYGQKVVKGNPNPRSYYKCTNPGCNVRKHVERASHDLKAVITTYEGKHNHDVPAARNSNHSNSGPSSAAAAAAAATQAQILHQRPELTHDGIMRFECRPPLGTFGLPGREQLNLGGVFSFGMGQHGFANLGGRGPLGMVRMPVIDQLHSYVGGNREGGSGEGGFVVPKGEPKEESVSESGLPIPSGMAAYHQLMSRLPLGPQL